MKKSIEHYLGPIILVLFLFSFVNPVFAAQTTTNQTNYIDKYFEVDKDGHWKMNIYLGDQKIATVDDAGTTTFPLTDHLGSTTIITDQTGQITEMHDYYPFGASSYKNLIQDTRTSHLFTGKEVDPENLLYYFGARYYDQNLGKFVSVDPFGQKLNELNDEKLNTFLSDPQRLNSYSYASNNPLNNMDVDGNLSIKALAHPGATAAQLGFWYAGINTYLRPNKLDVSAALLRHSLSWQPKNVNITTSNQSNYGNIIDKIKKSAEYKNFVEKQITLFEQENRNSFLTNDISGNKSLEFIDGDLVLAVGKVKISEFSGYKDSNGLWIISAQFDDKYDFSLMTSESDYNNDWFKTSANNAAYISQNNGVISNYSIKIKFDDKIKY